MAETDKNDLKGEVNEEEKKVEDDSEKKKTKVRLPMASANQM